MDFFGTGGHSPATLVSVLLFAGVWLGLATNVKKIAGRDVHPPSFHPILNAAHLGRFAGWALLGAAVFQSDPWTGGMLLITRLPAAALVGVTFVQRRTLRPSPGQLLRWLGPGFVGLTLVCAGLVWHPPPPIGYEMLRAYVAACFAVQAFVGLPAQIGAAQTKPLGNLRWFQIALLVNYAWMFVYAFWVEDVGVAWLMQGAYGVVFIEQAVLVRYIERGMRKKRRSEAGTAT